MVLVLAILRPPIGRLEGMLRLFKSETLCQVTLRMSSLDLEINHALPRLVYFILFQHRVE